jgi:hypothetical protein
MLHCNEGTETERARDGGLGGQAEARRSKREGCIFVVVVVRVFGIRGYGGA